MRRRFTPKLRVKNFMSVCEEYKESARVTFLTFMQIQFPAISVAQEITYLVVTQEINQN